MIENVLFYKILITNSLLWFLFIAGFILSEMDDDCYHVITLRTKIFKVFMYTTSIIELILILALIWF
jgi:hypothetical protein